MVVNMDIRTHILNRASYEVIQHGHFTDVYLLPDNAHVLKIRKKRDPEIDINTPEIWSVKATKERKLYKFINAMQKKQGLFSTVDVPEARAVFHEGHLVTAAIESRLEKFHLSSAAYNVFPKYLQQKFTMDMAVFLNEFHQGLCRPDANLNRVKYVAPSEDPQSPYISPNGVERRYKGFLNKEEIKYFQQWVEAFYERDLSKETLCYIHSDIRHSNTFVNVDTERLGLIDFACSAVGNTHSEFSQMCKADQLGFKFAMETVGNYQEMEKAKTINIDKRTVGILAVMLSLYQWKTSREYSDRHNEGAIDKLREFGHDLKTNGPKLKAPALV